LREGMLDDVAHRLIVLDHQYPTHGLLLSLLLRP
jgi:hypothetical protein